MLSFTETHSREKLFPLTLTREVADIRTGILTIREKWKLAKQRWPELMLPDQISANLVPGPDFFKAIAREGYEKAISDQSLFKSFQYPWDLPVVNGWAIEQDFSLVTEGRQSFPLSSTNKITGSANRIFVEEGAEIEHCYLNTTNGPIYIGQNATVMEGTMIRGPVSIGEGAVLKMGTTIYGATTIGPGCIIGGEVKNAIFFSFSNKAHHGYVGDAVIGSWCNLGAGTSCSNLRNNASVVKVWSMHARSFVDAGLKCGLIMGDYSRCGINTSFNTGTVVGISANIFQSGALQPKYIPSFSWGSEGEVLYKLEKAILDINNWMKFKGKSLSVEEKQQLEKLYNNIETL